MDFDFSTFDMIHTQSNIYGGDNIYDGNEMIGHTEPNIHGGDNFFSFDGSFAGFSSPNIFGGHNYNLNSGDPNPFLPSMPKFTL